jgi:hypothetical protein
VLDRCQWIPIELVHTGMTNLDLCETLGQPASTCAVGLDWRASVMIDPAKVAITISPRSVSILRLRCSELTRHKSGAMVDWDTAYLVKWRMPMCFGAFARMKNFDSFIW